MREVDTLVAVLQERFGHITIRDDYGWSDNSALSVLDCVLSLNRNYDRVVFPRVMAFASRRPQVRDLSHLQEILDLYPKAGDFCFYELDYNDLRREATLRGVIAYLSNVQARRQGETEHERLVAWAVASRPSDYLLVGVKGFGLAGFQYLRMLLGVQTTKPDVHIIRFVSNAIGKPVNDVKALMLLEEAATEAKLPLREVDGAIWEAGARGLQ